jgi:hypothetical protein
MLHLSPERLAAIADDEPNAAEALHLAGCAQCTSARRVQQCILVSARMLGQRDESPVTDWTTLQSRLLAEGLIATGHPAPQAGSPLIRRVGMLAAGLFVLAGGAVAGRVSAGAAPVPQLWAGRGAVREVAADEPAAFTSTAEALSVYLRAQNDLQRSASYLAVNDESAQASPQAAFTRLAALEEIFSASVAGLRQSPADPVLNDYYLSALTARDATRRQLEQVLHVAARRVQY